MSVRYFEHQVEFEDSLRANSHSLMDMMETELRVFAKIFDMEVQVYNQYPAWEYDPRIGYSYGRSGNSKCPYTG